jgi:predicted RNA-binding Zn-ribbon protein involved in translation (DUF1610 family)
LEFKEVNMTSCECGWEPSVNISPKILSVICPRCGKKIWLKEKKKKTARKTTRKRRKK